MAKKKRKRKNHKQLNLYIAIILIFVVIALLEAFIRKSRTEKYTYKPVTTETVQVINENVLLLNSLEVPLCGLNNHQIDHELRKFQNCNKNNQNLIILHLHSNLHLILL